MLFFNLNGLVNVVRNNWIKYSVSGINLVSAFFAAIGNSVFYILFNWVIAVVAFMFNPLVVVTVSIADGVSSRTDFVGIKVVANKISVVLNVGPNMLAVVKVIMNIFTIIICVSNVSFIADYLGVCLVIISMGATTGMSPG